MCIRDSSWASGIFFMGQGKAQESSSEAANAYYGAYLLALSLGDVALADWCRTLLAMEVRAARYYYHMPVGGEVYPARFADHNRVVGVLGALSTGAQTWFGPSPIYAHGIQILPVTPATEDLLKPPTFIAEDLAFLDQVLEGDAAVDEFEMYMRLLGWRLTAEYHREVRVHERAQLVLRLGLELVRLGARVRDEALHIPGGRCLR